MITFSRWCVALSLVFNLVSCGETSQGAAPSGVAQPENTPPPALENNDASETVLYVPPAGEPNPAMNPPGAENLAENVAVAENTAPAAEPATPTAETLQIASADAPASDAPGSTSYPGGVTVYAAAPAVYIQPAITVTVSQPAAPQFVVSSPTVIYSSSEVYYREHQVYNPRVALNGQGVWIEIEPGEFWFQPRLRKDLVRTWHPNYYGQLTWSSDYGTSIWVADPVFEPFGWATYHRGIWRQTASYGWIWFPNPDFAFRVDLFNVYSWDDRIAWSPFSFQFNHYYPHCHAYSHGRNRGFIDGYDRGYRQGFQDGHALAHAEIFLHGGTAVHQREFSSGRFHDRGIGENAVQAFKGRRPGQGDAIVNLPNREFLGARGQIPTAQAPTYVRDEVRKIPARPSAGTGSAPSVVAAPAMQPARPPRTEARPAAVAPAAPVNAPVSVPATRPVRRPVGNPASEVRPQPSRPSVTPAIPNTPPASVAPQTRPAPVTKPAPRTEPPKQQGSALPERAPSLPPRVSTEVRPSVAPSVTRPVEPAVVPSNVPPRRAPVATPAVVSRPAAAPAVTPRANSPSSPPPRAVQPQTSPRPSGGQNPSKGIPARVTKPAPGKPAK